MYTLGQQALFHERATVDLVPLAHQSLVFRQGCDGTESSVRDAVLSFIGTMLASLRLDLQVELDLLPELRNNIFQTIKLLD